MDRDIFKFILGIVLMVVFVGLLFLHQGKDKNQLEIEQRALKLKNKDCYDWQDVEYIIFGETQE